MTDAATRPVAHAKPALNKVWRLRYDMSGNSAALVLIEPWEEARTGPTVPPSMYSALMEVWRRSSLPRAAWYTQRRMRPGIAPLSQRMWATAGSYQAKASS